jgi:hypothetical protein
VSEVGALQFEESCEQFIQLHRAAPPIVVGRVDAEQSFITPVASREENDGHENEHEFFHGVGSSVRQLLGRMGRQPLIVQTEPLTEARPVRLLQLLSVLSSAMRSLCCASKQGRV